MSKFIFYNYLPVIANHIIDIRDISPNHPGYRIAHHNHPPFIIKNIKSNDIIFVKTDFLPDFFIKVYPLIKTPFYLLTGSSDYEIDSRYTGYLNENKIIMWGGFNITIEHKKIFKIPIAFEENELPGGNQALLTKLYDNKLSFTNKINKVLITSLGNTHHSRNNIISIFHNKDFCVRLNNRLSFEDFMNTISKYKFVLSPRGNGVDTHRFWEILLMGSIPIVESSGLDSLYDKFPCIIVKSFQQVNKTLLDSYKHNNEKEQNIEKYLLTNNFKEIFYQMVNNTKIEIDDTNQINNINSPIKVIPTGFSCLIIKST